MKIKVSDYIAEFLVEKGITQVFTVVGGGAMHLNDSFGHHSKLCCIYNHHEQACSIAAEGYARVHNKMAAVCVTSGPGAINALNGVVGAYMDSIPMLVFSGQTKRELTVRNSGLNLRTLGNQEFDIVSTLDNVCKYSEMIMDPKRIRYCLEKAFSVASSGRKGPCWLDIPLDVQATFVESDELKGYEEFFAQADISNMLDIVLDKLETAERPVFYAGNGIRWADGMELFRELLGELKIPVVTCWASIDLIETDDELYVGRAGIMGDRAGNFAVQNSDLLICVGTRLNIYQVGYDVTTWAREAFTVVVDVDGEELKKKTIRADLPICCDAGVFLKELLQKKRDSGNMIEIREPWLRQCKIWKKKYPVVREEHFAAKGNVNVYAFIDQLSRSLDENMVTVVANGSASVVGSHAYYIKGKQRFIMNCALSSMGYDLPAAIGACVANDRKEIVCIAGDGSMQMNLQELQTISTNKLPIKIFVLNNQGYHQIRQTQNNMFHNGLIGVGPDSGDLGFPDLEKLAGAYGLAYNKISTNVEMNSVIDAVLSHRGCILCEVVVDQRQNFEPKLSSKQLDDGTIISPPLEDMSPFLSRDELRDNMYVKLLEE